MTTKQPKKNQFLIATAAGRLAYYRAYAAWRSAAPQLGEKDWRAVRGYLYAPYNARATQSIRRSEDGRQLFADSFDCLGWRDCGNADDIADLRHNGWYADNHAGETIRGRVLQIPARDGRPQFVPATYCSGWGGVTVYLSDIREDKREAARVADSYAESEAEESREADAQDQAEQQIEEKRDEIADARRDCLALLREARPLRRAGMQSPAICAAIQREVKQYLRTIKRARDRVKVLSRDYWEAVA